MRNDDTEIINIHVDYLQYKEKQKDKFDRIQNRLLANYKPISVMSFAYQVGKYGKAFLASHLLGERKNSSFISQQIFAIDIDNCKDKKPLPLSESLLFEQCLHRTKKYGLLPLFAYESYNSTENNPRYRVVFLNDVLIEDPKAAEIMRNMLIKIFPEADSACTDAARIFFGGKELIYHDFHARINLFDVAVAMQMFIKDTTSTKHYAENIRRFANRNHIQISNKNMLQIYRIPQSMYSLMQLDMTSSYARSKKGDTGTTSNNIVEMVLTSPKIIINSKDFSYQILMNEKLLSQKAERACSQATASDSTCNDSENHKLLKHMQPEQRIAKLRRNCRLCDDFANDADSIEHNAKCVLLSSLIHVHGGETFFFEHLQKNVKKWKKDSQYFKEQGLHWQCEDYCPYHTECQAHSLYSKLSQQIIPVENNREYKSAEEVSAALENCMNECLTDPANCLHVIEAPTAIGKSYLGRKIIKSRIGTSEKPVLWAVPTHKLKSEQVFSLKTDDNLGPGLTDQQLLVTGSLIEILEEAGLDKLASDINYLYTKGLAAKVSSVVKKYLKKHSSEIYITTKHNILDYFQQEEHIAEANRNVITTHTMLLLLPEDILAQYEIIVDEDLLYTIFKCTAEVPISSLKAAIKRQLFPETEIFKEIMNAKDGTLIPLNLGAFPNVYMDRLVAAEDICANLPGLYEARSIYVSKGRDVYHESSLIYFTPRRIPNVKMIILSATANEELYRAFCKDRNVQYHALPHARNKGRIIQYTHETMSRACIDAIGFTRLKAAVDSITGDPTLPVITFKKFLTEKEQREGLYFGKTEGFNLYTGQSIVVLGTPHNRPYLYKLIGSYLGYNTNVHLSSQYLETEDYEFAFMTYCSKDMQNLQLFFISTEIIQAVGRARLLRCEDVVVFLFSNFPVEQAELHQDPYISY